MAGFNKSPKRATIAHLSPTWPGDSQLWANSAIKGRFSCPIWEDLKLRQDFMPVIIISKPDKALIENEVAMPGTKFPHFKPTEKYLMLKRHITLEWSNLDGTQSQARVYTCSGHLQV